MRWVGPETLRAPTTNPPDDGDADGPDAAGVLPVVDAVTPLADVRQPVEQPVAIGDGVPTPDPQLPATNS